MKVTIKTAIVSETKQEASAKFQACNVVQA
jgi:hypothetical protein